MTWAQIGNVSFVKKPGEINRNKQQLLRITGEKGTDRNAYIWVLKCRRCSNVYGSNSTDAFERKCPKCEQGTSGLAIPAECDGEKWTREEHVIAFNVYNRIEFGTIHMRNPEVIELAALLGRKVGSASRKLANFARLDPFHQKRDVSGLPHGAKGEEDVWEEFHKHPEDLAFESARLLSFRTGCSLEQLAEVDETDLPPPGLERDVLVKVRVNQGFFRKRVLSAYGFRCCITGLSTPAALVASHIVPWAEDARHRLNPRNGLCLNALHDRLFDRSLIWIDNKLVVHVSPSVFSAFDQSSEQTVAWLQSFDGKPLRIASDFRPDTDFLNRHARRCRELSV